MIYKYFLIMYSNIVLMNKWTANPDFKLGNKIWGIKSIVYTNSLWFFNFLTFLWHTTSNLNEKNRIKLMHVFGCIFYNMEFWFNLLDRAN